MQTWDAFLRQSDWEVVVRAPGNFFLAGEHAVMFGHPAVCQSFPLYFFVGIRRRLKDSKVNLDTESIFFVDALDPEKKRTQFEYPSRMVACQLERLLEASGWRGFDIGFYSELPSMCGLASSGALSAALSIGLNYISERHCSKADLESALNKIWNPRRCLKEVIADPVFSKILFPLAWRIDSLFHNHQSSGANAFFSLVGSPSGLPAFYRQTKPRRGDLDTPTCGFNPSRTFSSKLLCPRFGEHPKPGIPCPDHNVCPNFVEAYSSYDRFPYEAQELADTFPSAGSDLFRFCCALVFSGHVKTTERAIRMVKARVSKIGAYLSQVPYLHLGADAGMDVVMAYLGAVATELWETLGCYFEASGETKSKGIEEIVGYAQSGLRNLLWLSTDEIDQICRRAELHGFGAKLTGAGTGGDVVIVARDSELPRLQEFIGSLEKLSGSRFRKHFLGEWSRRDFGCSPHFVKKTAKRFLAALDISKSKDMRRRGGDTAFDTFTEIVNRVALGKQGCVLSYHRTDDQRLTCFESCDKVKAFLTETCAEIKSLLGKNCWAASLETPFDWEFLRDSEPSAEQSWWISELVHGLKVVDTT